MKYWDISETKTEIDGNGLRVEIPEQKDYVFFSGKPFDESKVEDIKNNGSKARFGIWASELTPRESFASPWAALTVDTFNGFYMEERGATAEYATVFRIDEGARVLYIGSQEDYEKVADIYGRTDDFLGSSFDGEQYLDYEKIALDYDGIHVNYWTNDDGPLGGYDIESIQMFRANSIDIKYSGENPFDIVVEKPDKDSGMTTIEHYNINGTLMIVEKYDENSNKIERQINNSNGDPNSVTVYNVDGKELRESMYSYGKNGSVTIDIRDSEKETSTTEHYVNGKIESIEVWKGRTQEISKYNEEGKMISKEFTDYESKTITVTTFDENGNKEKIETYDSKTNELLSIETQKEGEQKDNMETNNSINFNDAAAQVGDNVDKSTGQQESAPVSNAEINASDIASQIADKIESYHESGAVADVHAIVSEVFSEVMSRDDMSQDEKEMLINDVYDALPDSLEEKASGEIALEIGNSYMEQAGLSDKIDVDRNDMEVRDYPKPDDTGTTDKIQYDTEGNILWIDHIDENGYSKYTDFYDKDGNIEMTSVYVRDEDGNNLSVTTYDGDGNLMYHNDLEKDGSAEATRDDIVDSIYDALGVNDMDASPGDIDSIDVSMDDLLSDYFHDICINEVSAEIDDRDRVDGKEEFSFEAFSVDSEPASGRD